MRYSFNLTPQSDAWNHLKKQHLLSLSAIATLTHQPNHTQNQQDAPTQMPTYTLDTFKNEPPTNWWLPHHITWAHTLTQYWQQKKLIQPQQTTPAALSVCLEAPEQTWHSTPFKTRQRLLKKTAQIIRQKRGFFIGLMASETGKTFTESDTEICEAIDFLEYYALTHESLENDPSITTKPKGTGLVISPWNFPLAIPCGGIAASLIAGNKTILKPAPEATLIGQELINCFWEAGVPTDALHSVICTNNSPTLHVLIMSKSIRFIIFTGSTQTAELLHKKRPDIALYAETGGKNTTIITNLADQDLAIQHVVQSAFSNAGQKCSATSVLILEKDVYENAEFIQKLTDAIESIPVGLPWQLDTIVSPLISQPNPALARALTHIEPHEKWLIPPKPLQQKNTLLAPIVKWHCKPKTFSHQTECFGPVLAIFKAENLADAITIANSTGYGLTAGLETLDASESDSWKKSIYAGNLYINKPTTGAIVKRQPFGGLGKSSFGDGFKAGGPHYTHPFVTLTNTQKQTPKTTFNHYKACYTTHFNKQHITMPLIGEKNTLYYQPKGHIGIRINTPKDSLNSDLIIKTALLTKNRITLSIDPSIPFKSNHTIIQQTHANWLNTKNQYDGTINCQQEPLHNGHLELPRYLTEISCSQTTHRFGALETE